ncbi:MAG: hypothetical protein IPG85_07395 [Bacteroidetes bacterium]|nr:hypothetical protein [Bacteroidota bacterium]
MEIRKLESKMQPTEIIKFQVDERELSSSELAMLLSFYIYLVDKKSIVLRGENYDSLMVKFRLQPTSEHTLSEFVFMLGEKGKVYRKTYRNSLNRNQVFSINSTADKVFEYIFDKINKVISSTKNIKIKQHLDLHKDLNNFFNNKANKEIFIAKIRTLEASSKLKVRDYYLRFLHQYGKVGLSNKSFFISSTQSMSTAKYFASNENGEDIIFLSWQIMRYDSNIAICKRLELPVFHSAPFRWQREVTLKGYATSFILGYYKVKSQIFQVNPHF